MSRDEQAAASPAGAFAAEGSPARQHGDAAGTPVAEARGPDESVSYHFPIEVEIIGELSAQHRHELARHVYEELEDALRARS